MSELCGNVISLFHCHVTVDSSVDLLEMVSSQGEEGDDEEDYQGPR